MSCNFEWVQFHGCEKFEHMKRNVLKPNLNNEKTGLLYLPYRNLAHRLNHSILPASPIFTVIFANLYIFSFNFFVRLSKSPYGASTAFRNVDQALLDVCASIFVSRDILLNGFPPAKANTNKQATNNLTMA